MIKFDGEFDDEACELGARYLSDNEGSPSMSSSRSMLAKG